MEFTEPLPFSEALDKLQVREILPSALSSTEWREVEIAIREKAFFSSRVESARLLQTMKDYLGDYMAGARMENGGLKAQGRAEFVADMRELAIREGLGRVDEKTGKIAPFIRENDLTDIRSTRRLQLIFDTQVESAHEYGFWKQGQNPDILWVYPCQRFIRIRPVLIPRDYHAAHEGVIKRKDDLDFWLDMNRDFNVPWGPWGFASGMGVEDVMRDEAVAAGVLGPDELVRPIEQTFNNGLSAGIRDLDGGLAAALARITGGTVAKGRMVARETPALPEIKIPPIAKLFERYDYTTHGQAPKVLPFTESLLRTFYEQIVKLPDGRQGVVTSYNIKSGLLIVAGENQDWTQVPWQLAKIVKP